MSEEIGDTFAQLRSELESQLIAAISKNPDKIAEVSPVLDGSEIDDQFLSTWYRASVDLYEAGKFSQSRLRTELRKAGFLKDPSEAAEFRNIFIDPTAGSEALWCAVELSRITAVKRMQFELEKALIQTTDIRVDPDKLVSKLNATLDAIIAKQSTSIWEMGEDVAVKVHDTHRENLDAPTLVSASTGYVELDQATGGFFAGQLWQIAARSYMGKTAAALNFSLRQLGMGHGVYIASYEMDNSELMERMFAAEAGIPLRKFSLGEITQIELKRIEQIREKMRGLPLFMDQRPPDSVKALRARVKLAQNVSDIKLVVVDHLGMFPHTDRRVQRHQQLVEVTREMKAMAKELGLTILLLNQLNTDADGEEPSDKHYAESKGVITNMDVSILLHRETKTSDELLCIGTKSRRTKPFRCKLQFDGEIQRIEGSSQPPLDF